MKQEMVSLASLFSCSLRPAVKTRAIHGLLTKPGGYVLAVDFDGTLCEDRWPDIGLPNNGIIAMAKKARDMGALVVLWTCREGEKLEEALAWCQGHGLSFDAVNDNPAPRKALYGNNPRKIGYDELWDDRSTGPFRKEGLVGLR